MDYFQEITYLVIETNSSCNLDCQFCNRGRLKSMGLRRPMNVTLERFSQMLDVFKGCNIDTIKLEGLSEPMLHPHFDLMAAELKGRFPRSFVIIATNLQYGLRNSPFQRTLPWVDMVYLSIDGTGKIYEEIRSGAKYDRLLENLHALKSTVDETERKGKLFINCTITERNYRELPLLYDLSEQFGLAGVRINLAQNWNEDEPNTYRISSDLLEFLAPYRNDVKGVAGWEYKNCFWPFSGVVVDVFGNVRQCLINTSQTPLINIFKDNFKSFFNQGAHYQRVRQDLARNRPPPSCINCDYSHLSPYLERIFGAKFEVNRPRTFKSEYQHDH